MRNLLLISLVLFTLVFIRCGSDEKPDSKTLHSTTMQIQVGTEIQTVIDGQYDNSTGWLNVSTDKQSYGIKIQDYEVQELIIDGRSVEILAQTSDIRTAEVQASSPDSGAAYKLWSLVFNNSTLYLDGETIQLKGNIKTYQ